MSGRATYLSDAADLMVAVTDTCLEDIVAASEILIESFRAGGTLLICGNGGSAADAQHLATEFVSALTLDASAPAMRAIALTTDTSALTAIANDFGVERMFARQVEAIGRAGDVLLGDLDERQLRQRAGRRRERARAGDARGRADRGIGRWAGPARRCRPCVCPHGDRPIQECHLAIEQLLALLAERA